MGGQNEIVSPGDVVPKLGGHAVRVGGSGHDGMAIVPQHVGVDRVDLRDFHIKGLGARVNDEVDAADGCLSFGQNIGHFMHRAVEARAKGLGEAVDQRLAPAGYRVVLGVLGGVFARLGQKAGARSVIGDEHALNPHILQVIFERLDIVEEAGRLQHHGPAVFFEDKDLVVHGVVGLVGVKFDGAKVVKVDFTLLKGNGAEGVLVHNGFLLWVKSMGFILHKRPLPDV